MVQTSFINWGRQRKCRGERKHSRNGNKQTKLLPEQSPDINSCDHCKQEEKKTSAHEMRKTVVFISVSSHPPSQQHPFNVTSQMCTEFSFVRGSGHWERLCYLLDCSRACAKFGMGWHALMRLAPDSLYFPLQFTF